MAAYMTINIFDFVLKGHENYPQINISKLKQNLHKNTYILVKHIHQIREIQKCSLEMRANL